MRTTRLPAVDWTDAPADLNGLVRFGERRNLVSASVPSGFKRAIQTWVSPLSRREWWGRWWQCRMALHLHWIRGGSAWNEWPPCQPLQEVQWDHEAFPPTQEQGLSRFPSLTKRHLILSSCIVEVTVYFPCAMASRLCSLRIFCGLDTWKVKEDWKYFSIPCSSISGRAFLFGRFPVVALFSLR